MDVDALKTVEIERFCYSSFGTFGDIKLPDGSELASVEQVWLENKKSVSCIPVGEYVCRRRMYHRGGYEAFEILDVKNRKYILFHVANWPRQVKGCIGVCETHGSIAGQWAGINSRQAFDHFMRSMDGCRYFRLIISNRAGGVL